MNIRDNAVQCAPPAPTQILQQQGELEQAVRDNRELVTQLMDRLSPVLRTESENGKNETSAPEAVLVSLAEDIRARCKTVRGTNFALNSILGRIEL